MNPYQVVKDFEQAVAQYTDAHYCVAVNSCSAALMLAVAWHLRNVTACKVCGITAEQIEHAGGHLCDRSPCGHSDIRKRDIEIPKRTYLSVPMSIIHAGGRPTFRDVEWLGSYQLKPLPVWDSARWFTCGLYYAIKMKQKTAHGESLGGPMVCTSHHWSKTLGIQQGGCILHDDPEADAWLRRARFDGRTEGVAPKDDNITQVGWHCYMSPEVAAEGLVRLHFLPKHNAPLPNDQYPDLSTMEIFK